MNAVTADLNVPLFSIILPTCNRPDTFLRAVSSVIKQSLRKFELIVIDDFSSTDYAQTICDDLSIPCRVIINSSNLGAAGSRNVGIKAARGTYVTFLDDDDEFKEFFLESTYYRLRDTSDQVGLSWCGVQCIDYPETPGGTPVFRTRMFSPTYETQVELFEQMMSIGTGFGVTIKATCFKKVGLFDCNLKTGSDTEMFLRILSAGYLPVVVPDAHVVIHNHHGIRLTDRKMHRSRLIDTKQLITQHANFLKKNPSLFKQLEKQVQLLSNEAGVVHFA
jgi:glycosyltransferase involved in cell wall biosynthesis